MRNTPRRLFSIAFCTKHRSTPFLPYLFPVFPPLPGSSGTDHVELKTNTCPTLIVETPPARVLLGLHAPKDILVAVCWNSGVFNHYSYCTGALMSTVNWVSNDICEKLGIASIVVLISVPCVCPRALPWAF